MIKEVNDAIKYLATLDRVYSEHVRPRFGKRTMEHVDEGELLEKRSGVMEALMVGDKAMRDYVKYMSQVTLKNNMSCGNALD